MLQALKIESRYRQVQDWFPILIGLLCMYLPTFFHLSETIWTSDEQAHGPLVIMIVAYLFWSKREQFSQPVKSHDAVIGALFLLIGFLTYIIGRSQEVMVLDVASIIPVLMGLMLIKHGPVALKHFWFPLFFLFFLIPLPGSLLDVVTLPMKVAVSYVASSVLYLLDYPIARSGVVLHIGPYQLLVADACAGMHTLISLEAMGLLYLNLVKHDSFLRNLTLGILIIPISFTANVIRVMSLVLITYYFGDEVGQGFIHGFAGMLLFIVALILIMSIDSLIQYFVSKKQSKKVAA